MEKTTEIIIGLENVVPLPCREVSDENQWTYVEFPYKHLLPVLEASWKIFGRIKL